MAIKKTINIDINAKSAIKTLDELGGSFEDANGEGAIPLSTTIGELEDRLYAMAAAGDTASKEFNEISGQVGKMKKVIIDTDLTLDGMSQNLTQNVGGALTGVASGFALAQGAMGSFGIGGQAVEESLLKVQSAMAMAQGLQGIKESISSFKALKKSVMAMTVVQKFLNFVMSLNPIGLIIIAVVALGAAIALLWSPVKKLLQFMGLLSADAETAAEANKRITATIDAQGAALDRLKAKQEKMHSDRMRELKLEGASEKEIHDQILKDLKDKEINRKKSIKDSKKNVKDLQKAWNAALKEGDEENRKSLSEKLNSEKKNVRLLRDNYKSYTLGKQEEDVRYNAGKVATDKETTDKEKAELATRISNYKTHLANRLSAARKIQDLALQEESTEIERNNVKYARLIEDTKNNENLKQSEKDKIIKSYDALRVVDEKKIIETIETTKVAAQKKEYDREDAQYALLNELSETEEQKKITSIVKGYEDKFALAIGNAELEKELLRQQKEDIAVINAEYAEKDAAIASETKQKSLDDIEGERQAKLAALDAGFDKAQEVANAIQGMGDIMFAAKLAKVEKGSAAEEKLMRKQFQFNKAMQLSGAVIDAGKAIIASLSVSPLTVLGVPNPGAIAALALTGITSAVNIAKIASTKFGGSQTPPPTPGPLSIGGGAASPAFNVVGNTGINQLAEGLGNQDNSPIQAYVVSGDVTTAQSLDRNKIDTATI